MLRTIQISLFAIDYVVTAIDYVVTVHLSLSVWQLSFFPKCTICIQQTQKS